MNKLLVLAFLLTLPISSFNIANATIISVPSQHSTIQRAINASSNGDTVVVSPGIYYENINFRGKSIVLTSLFYLSYDTSYISSTIINGSTPLYPDSASCIILNSYEDSTTVIQGFTITGGAGTKWVDIHGAGTYREGGGILTEFSSPIIRYNYIHDNYVNKTTGVSSTGGGAIRCGDGSPVIINNIICNNQAYGYGGGIVSNYCTSTIQNNLIANNSGGHAYGGGGIWLTGANINTQVNVINNTIVNNHVAGTGTYSGKGGGVFVFTIRANLENNIVWGNTQSSGNAMRTFAGGLIVANYCDVQNTTSGIGNISAAPLFSDSTYFFLTSTSPCVDSGDPFAPFNDLTISMNTALFPSLGTELNDIGYTGGPTVAVLPVCENTTTGIDDFQENIYFNYFPNPADSYLLIHFADRLYKSLYVELINQFCQKLIHQPVSETEIKLNVSSFSSGLYVLRIVSSSKQFVSEKIQIIH